MGEEIDARFATKVGRSAGDMFRGGRVLLGLDGRTSSPMLAEGVAAGLLSQGTDVVDVGTVPTPALQFLVKKVAAVGGIMVTASHNPPEYNGFKLVDSDGVEIPRAKEEKIEKLMHSDEWRFHKTPGQRVQPEGLLDLYITSVKSHVGNGGKLFRGRKVIVDAGNGVSVLTTPKALRDLGAEVITLNDNIDGKFPGRPSEPRPETLTALSKLVEEERADLGVAHDGDGDRAMFADETGTVHWGDRTFALVADEVLKKNKGGRLVTPVNSSLALDEITRKRGGKLVLTRVGSIFVSRKMLEVKAILGGEENGGIFYAPLHPVRDGTMAALLILEAIVRNKLSLSKLLSRLPTFFMAKEKFPCGDHAHRTRAMSLLKLMLGKRITTELDGIRVDLDRGWVLIRPSGTEPLLRMYAEGRTEEALREIVSEFEPMVKEALER